MKFANILVHVAKKTKDYGILYPSGVCDFEDLVMVAIQDAAFANDYEASGSGNRMGFRSRPSSMTTWWDTSSWWTGAQR